jgi:DNA-binding CsgD family transcriptional regulator
LRVDGSHEVWARGVVSLIDLAVHVGLPTDGLFDGLPFDEPGLRKRRHVRWDDYCEIMERVAQRVGIERVEDLLETSYHQVVPEVRAFAGSLISPKVLYRFMIELVDPVLFPMLKFRYEDLRGSRIRIDLRLAPGLRPSEPFFRGSLGGIRGMSHHLELPAAEVVSMDVGGDHLFTDLELPPSRTLASRASHSLQRVLKLVLGHNDDGKPLAVTFGDAGSDALESRLEHATAEWRLTPRQAEVLRFVVRGDANKDIAHSLGCAESTVEVHVTQLLRRSDTSSRTQLVARFWSTSGFPV